MAARWRATRGGSGRRVVREGAARRGRLRWPPAAMEAVPSSSCGSRPHRRPTARCVSAEPSSEATAPHDQPSKASWS